MKTELVIGATIIFVGYCLRKRFTGPDIFYRSELPHGYNAMTVPPFGIFILESERGNDALLQHEMMHWDQFVRNGLLPYYGRYFFEMHKYGYDNMPMELEARQNECEPCRREYTKCVRMGIADTVYAPDFRR